MQLKEQHNYNVTINCYVQGCTTHRSPEHSESSVCSDARKHVNVIHGPFHAIILIFNLFVGGCLSQGEGGTEKDRQEKKNIEISHRLYDRVPC